MEVKYQYRTDFASERLNKEIVKDNVIITNDEQEFTKLQIINVLDDNNVLDTKKGTYISIAFDHLQDHAIRDEVKSIMQEQLKNLISKKVQKIDKCLIVGLGNRNVVADALGSDVCSKVIVTSHLFENDCIEKTGVSNVSAIAPGVMGQTGIESSDIIKGICEEIKPNLVLVVDALATKNMQRINKMIQISDNGIQPGSGVGNNRKAIDEQTLKVPVIVIGVATVVDILSITKEVVEQALLYEKKEVLLDEVDKIIDNLKYTNASNMIVTLRAMDEDLVHLSDIISYAINASLHAEFPDL